MRVRKALRKLKAGPIVFAALLLLPDFRAPGSTNDWYARSWRSDEGLPDNDVSGIAQTADGFLWVGTKAGLVRFDGNRFDEFSVLNIKSVPSGGVRTLFLDKSGRLWLSMDRGIVVCVESTSAKVYSTEDGLPATQLQAFAEDADGGIWISYGGRRTIACIKDDRVTLFGEGEGIPGGASWIAPDSKGELWLAKGGHLSVFRKGKFVSLINFPQDGNVRIAPAAKRGIWISSGSKIWKYEEGGDLQDMGELPGGISATALMEDRSGALWIGTGANGLFRRNDSGLERMPSSHRQIECLYEGREGNIWVGTDGGGLNRVRPRAVQLIGTEEGLPFETVRSVCQESSGAIWIVTENGLLASRKGSNWSIMSQSTDWPGGFPTCVANDTNGGVWIGTSDHGLYRFQDGQFQNWRVTNGLSSDNIRGLLINPKGDVWITYFSRLQKFHQGVFQTIPLPTGTRYLRAMAEDASGDLWCGTSDGALLHLQNNELEDETEKIQHGPASIRCLYTTSDGALWIGYASFGLGHFKNGKYARITTAEGLKNNFISQIVEDKMGRLWIASNGGIFQLSLAEASEVADDLASGRRARLRSIAYGRAEGLPSLQPNYDITLPSAMRSADGQIWMAMRTGLAVVHTENIRDNPDLPPVLVERVTEDGQAIAVYDSKSPMRDSETRALTDLHQKQPHLHLKANYRRLEIDFTALSFLAPENVNFRYRLEPLEDDWSEAGTERKATYLHLSSGDYTFHVIACNNSGVWNEAGAKLNFTVLPFFWQRTSFQLSMLAVFTLCVIAIVRYVSFRRLRDQVRLLEQQTLLHKERARIAKDIHDDLGANLTQITLLSELTRQDMAAPVKAGEHVEKISTTARQVMKSLDEIVWAVNPRNDTLPHLVDYLGQFTIDFLRAPGIRCRLDLPEHPPEINVPADIRHNLFLAVKEALNNIVKHAGAKEVRLGMDVSNGKLHVVITDDGHGFERPPQDAWADGLRNMRQRMAEIGGDCSIESHAGAGTTITFDVPWRN
jgi:signal transduction histidine kinase/ligand-binding sensor domain-containing protein